MRDSSQGRSAKQLVSEQELATQDLLRQWRDLPVTSTDTGVDDQKQLQALRGVLGGVAQSRARFKRRRPLFFLAAAACVAAMAAFFVWGEGKSANSLGMPRAQVPAGATNVQTAQLGAEFGAGNSAVQLAFPSGAQAEIFPATRGHVSAAGENARESLFLLQGSVEVRVPKFAQPVEFAVNTPRARVVVHGTVFRVDVASAKQGAGTRVSVTRGVVSVHVRGKLVRRLTAGQSWSEPVVEAVAEVSEPTAQKLPRKVRASKRLRRATRRKRSSVLPPVPASATLAEENALFAVAMKKKRAGEMLLAVVALERFIRDYPRSVLTQEVRIERFRMLREAGLRKQAKSAAQEYLVLHPAGYARQEALALTRAVQ